MKVSARNFERFWINYLSTKWARHEAPSITITNASGKFGSYGLVEGDCITVVDFRPWYVRLWRWITRYKPPVMRITKATATTLTVTSVDGPR